MTGMFGGSNQTDASPQTRAVESIAKGPSPDLSSEQKFAELVQRHDYQLKTLAQGQKQLQKGVNDATQNPIQQLQQFVSDIVVLLGGGELAEGLLDFGDLQYILPALGALLGLGDGPFPIDLFQAAERFFLGYIVPTRQFTDVINKIIDAWAGLLGIDKKFVTDVNKLITSVGQLFDGLGNLLPSVNSFFDALGLNPNDLGPLGVVLAPIIKLFSGLDLSSFGNAIEFITDSIDPYIVQLTAVINFANEVLAVMGAVQHGINVINDPLPELIVPFQNLVQFLGNTNLAIRGFNPITAAQQFIGRLNVPASSITVYGPNLQNDGGFDDPTSIADYGEWVWDLLGHTAAGAATVHADGTPHALLGTEIPAAEGQTLAISVWALWTGVTATGSPIALQLKTDTAGIIPIAAVASPGASSGGWVQLSGTWAVPADVNVLRIRLLVDSGCTAGQVWFDDAVIDRTNLIPQAAVETLAGDLHDLFGNFTAMFTALATGDITAFNVALSAAVFDANRAGTLITEALTTLGLTTASQLATALTNAITGLQALINGLWNIFTGNTGVTGKILSDVTAAGGAFFAGAAGAATKLNELIAALGETVWADVVAIIQSVIAIGQNWATALNALGVAAPLDLVKLLQGLFPAALPNLLGFIPTSLDGFVDNLDGTWSFIAGQGQNALTNLHQLADGAIVSADHVIQQAVQGASQAGVAPGQAIAAGQQMLDHGIAVLANDAVQAGQGVEQWAAAQASSFQGWVNALTGSHPASAGSPEFTAAQQQLAAQAAAQAQLTAAINAQIPHLYGGTGTAGFNAQIAVTPGTLPAGFGLITTTHARVAAMYGTPFQTDSQTIGGVWNASDYFAKYLFLRMSADGATYVYCKLESDGYDFASYVAVPRSEIGYSIGGVKTVLGTFSIGTTGLFQANSGYTFEATGYDFTIIGPNGLSTTITDTFANSKVGVLYQNWGWGHDGVTLNVTGNNGGSWGSNQPSNNTALPAAGVSGDFLDIFASSGGNTNSTINGRTLTIGTDVSPGATINMSLVLNGTTTVNVPGGYPSYAVSPGVGMRGLVFNEYVYDNNHQYTFHDNSLTGKAIFHQWRLSLPGSLSSISAYDSGPSSGPATASVATSENYTSASYGDLATPTDQVTVNIGPSGLAMVFLDNWSSLVVPSGGGQTFMSFTMSGANTQAASDNFSIGITVNTNINGFGSGIGAPFLITSLFAGPTTFKLKYRVTNGTGTFSSRRIAVIPL